MAPRGLVLPARGWLPASARSAAEQVGQSEGQSAALAGQTAETAALRGAQQAAERVQTAQGAQRVEAAERLLLAAAQAAQQLGERVEAAPAELVRLGAPALHVGQVAEVAEGPEAAELEGLRLLALLAAPERQSPLPTESKLQRVPAHAPQRVGPAPLLPEGTGAPAEGLLGAAELLVAAELVAQPAPLAPEVLGAPGGAAEVLAAASNVLAAAAAHPAEVLPAHLVGRAAEVGEVCRGGDLRIGNWKLDCGF